MRRLYDKNELMFSLLWIGAYVVLFSIADGISADLGTAKLVTAPLCVIMSAFLLFWIKQNDLLGKYGLVKAKIDHGQYLYFLPLVFIASTNIWCGVTLRYSVLETVLYVISMIGVGFIEEIIFRGFLFKTLCKDNVKQAIIISSATFGIGHIVNLLNGAEVVSTLLQICYATAAGFLFTIIFYKSGSLLPCIMTHSAINSLSAFAVESTESLDIITAIALTGISIIYTIWILNKENKTK